MWYINKVKVYKKKKDKNVDWDVINYKFMFESWDLMLSVISGLLNVKSLELLMGR